MSEAMRNRRNRMENNGVRGQVMLCGAVLDVKVEKTGRESLFEVKSVAPGTASFAGRLADDLLPVPEGEN